MPHDQEAANISMSEAINKFMNFVTQQSLTPIKLCSEHNIKFEN